MLPIRDINPTRIFPIITISLIAANILIFFGWQNGMAGSDAEIEEFLYENAAIACEIRTGDPLTQSEINSGVCDDQNGIEGSPGPAGTSEAHPDKDVLLSVVVSMFLHGGLFHLFGNMWFLWIFGNNIEDAMGPRRFVAFYLLAGVLAALAQIFSDRSSPLPLVGASGAVSAIMGAYVVLYPKVRVHSILVLGFFITRISLPAYVMLLYWAALQMVGSLVGGQSAGGVAFVAHLGGFAAGVVMIKLFTKPDLLAAARRQPLMFTTSQPWRY